MNNKERVYNISVSLIFFLVVVILAIIDKNNNIKLSLEIQVLIIIYLSNIVYANFKKIKEQYKNQKYSYSIIMNLGLVLFLIINIFRQINLLITNGKLTNINDLYNNTLNSFSYFVVFILPLIVFLAFYSVIANIFLIVKEGFVLHNLLGLMFGVCITIGAFASQIIFEFVKNIELINSQIYIKKFIDIGLNAVLCYFYCLTLATLYCNIMAGIHKPNYDKDFVIILGAKVREDGSLTPVLKARVDKAIEFAKNQKYNSNKNIIFIPSGGKGNDEIISESEAMKKYLLQNGINEKDIIIENKSTNTFQNMKFSKQKIDEINKNGKIIFSTTNYHVFRSGVIANNEGIDCEGIGSSTKWYFYTNAIIREFVANLFSQRKQHLLILSLVNIIILILVLIGDYYNLL